MANIHELFEQARGRVKPHVLDVANQLGEEGKGPYLAAALGVYRDEYPPTTRQTYSRPVGRRSTLVSARNTLGAREPLSPMQSPLTANDVFIEKAPVSNGQNNT